MSREISALPGTTLDASQLQPGDIIDYGNGVKGFVARLGDMAPPQDIASGFSVLSAREAGQIDAYEDFFNGYDFNYMRSAAAASIRGITPFNLAFFNDDMAFDASALQSPQQAMTLSEKYFTEDPIAGRIIELMAQLSIAGMRHQCKDEKVRTFYDQWANNTDFFSVLNRIFLSYYLSANVYVLKTLSAFKTAPVNDAFKFLVDPEAVQTKASGTGEQALDRLALTYAALTEEYMAGKVTVEKMLEARDVYLEACAHLSTQGARKHIWSKSYIPRDFTILDPKAVTIDGPGDFGLGVLKYKVSQKLADVIKAPKTPYQKKLVLNLPKDFVSQVKGGANDVELDPNLVSEIHRMKLDYQPLAFPLMTRAFRSLHMKNRTREMDAATLNSMITQMVIVRVGSDKFPAKPAQMKALAQAWIEAMQSKTLTLFWNHTIEVERVPVNIEVLGKEKYEVWNNDIRDAFGVAPLLLGRVEGDATSGYVSVKGFLENLQSGRDDVLNQFVYPEYHGIAVAMGFPGYPEVVFDKFKLNDEAAMTKVLISLVQQGILDYETVVEELGYNWKQILERHTDQAKLKDDGTIRVMAPYKGEDNGTPTPGSSPEGGRPPGSNNGPGSSPNQPRPKDKSAPDPRRASASQTFDASKFEEVWQESVHLSGARHKRLHQFVSSVARIIGFEPTEIRQEISTMGTRISKRSVIQAALNLVGDIADDSAD